MQRKTSNFLGSFNRSYILSTVNKFIQIFINFILKNIDITEKSFRNFISKSKKICLILINVKQE